MNKTSFGIATVSMAFACVLAAQTAQNPATNPGSQKVAPPMQFSSLDTNKDGRVSKDEVKTHAELTSSFATLDTNRDTYLSESEFGKWSSDHSSTVSPPAGGMTPPAGNMEKAPAPRSGVEGQ